MTYPTPEPENWQIVEPEFRLEDTQHYETLFALGNGYLGLRGTFEEGLGRGSVEGTYINGFYERRHFHKVRSCSYNRNYFQLMMLSY